MSKYHHNTFKLVSWRSLLLIPIISLTLSIAHKTCQAAIIEGVVFSEQGPEPEAAVYAYSSYEDLVANRFATKSEPGNKSGQFSLQLSPGSYYLVARAHNENRKLFSYHGVNPIVVSEDYRWLPFLLVENTTTNCATDSSQGISGQVTYKNQPVSGGVVSVYPWQDGKFRGMGLLTNTLDESGKFSFSLQPGSYVVIARKKQDVRGIGPVKQGDLYCYPSANPISVENGQLCTVQINCYPRDNLALYLDDGVISPQGRRHDSRRQASLHDLQPVASQAPQTSKMTRINGTVTDSAGKPVSGLTITAYPDNGLNLFQMHIVRLITNDMGRSGQDGRFSIDLKDGGRYYLIAREKVGEAPERGEYYGIYEGSPNHSITINSGEIINEIDIFVDQIMPHLPLDYVKSSK